MTQATKYPATASVYELVRTKPGAMAKLESAGVTRDLFGLRIRDAASEAGITVERITEIVEEGVPG